MEPKEIFVSVPMSEEDCRVLHGLHYQVEARMSLLMRLMGGSLLIDDREQAITSAMQAYDEIYPKYDAYKRLIEEKYKPSDGQYEYWVADFDNQLIKFYQSNA